MRGEHGRTLAICALTTTSPPQLSRPLGPGPPLKPPSTVTTDQSASEQWPGTGPGTPRGVGSHARPSLSIVTGRPSPSGRSNKDPTRHRLRAAPPRSPSRECRGPIYARGQPSRCSLLAVAREGRGTGTGRGGSVHCNVPAPSWRPCPACASSTSSTSAARGTAVRDVDSGCWPCAA